MAATALPSSGAPDGPLGCDTSDLFVVHNLLRLLYSDAPALASGVADGDTERAGIVADHLADLIVALHDHHHTEDDELWDRLEQRDPGCTLHVERMRMQHHDIAGILDELDAALPAWRAAADPASRAAVVAGLERVLATLRHHLGDEEDNILPVAGRSMTQAEWDHMGKVARDKVRKDRLLIQLGFLLESIPAGEREEWKKEFLPGPVRLLWNISGRRKYEKYRARVYGTAA